MAPQLARSLYLGEDCFMSGKGWVEIFTKYPAETEEEVMRFALIRYMCLWPNVARGVRQCRNDNNPIKLIKTLSTLVELRLGLYEINLKLQAIFNQRKHVRIGQSLRGDDLVSLVFQYRNWEMARLVALHAGTSLIVERMISVLGAQQLVYTSCATEMKDPLINAEPGQVDIQSLCMRVWMTYEHAWTIRPIGSQFMLVPLISSYLYAGPAMQNWIIKTLNEMDEHRMLKNPRYNHASICRFARIYTGEEETMLNP